MTKYFLIKKDDDGRVYYLESTLMDSKLLKVLANPTRLKILRELSEKPMSTSELSNIFRETQQKIHYHINLLKKSGIINILRTIEKRGTIEKIYDVQTESLAYIISSNWKPIEKFEEINKENHNILYKFFYPIPIDKKVTIVVGSAESHGRYYVGARDQYIATYIANLLGREFGIECECFTDEEIEKDKKRIYGDNIIVIGGPLVNTFYYHIKRYLPFSFEIKNVKMKIIKSYKEYSKDNIGVICKIKNPRNLDKCIIYIAGVSRRSTINLVKTLAKNPEKLIKDYKDVDIWYHIYEISSKGIKILE